jgi:Polysaccharide deacetylase
MNKIAWMLSIGVIVGGLSAAAAEDLRGGLVLQFDDGWHSWLTEVAPLVQAHGGVATGFVNDKYIDGGRITIDELLRLQEEFGWEIGSHTAHHYHAPRYVQNKSVEDWLASELDPSLKRLREEGLEVNAMVFPFNASTPEVAEAALTRVGSYRRIDSLALAKGVRGDGSLPGTSIDTTQYVPMKLIKKWIDMAHKRDLVLFLYGHRILPDSAFTEGAVTAVSSNTVTLDRPVQLDAEEGNVLIPNMARRQNMQNTIVVQSAEGNTVTVLGLVPPAVEVGATVLVGPSYGTRSSDFDEMLAYAEERLHFYTIQDIQTLRDKKEPSSALSDRLE